MNKPYIVLGLMSGTSLDGLDLALCKFEQDIHQPQWTILAAETQNYPEEWIARLAYLPQQNAEILAKTNVMYGHLLGKMTTSFLKKYKIKPDVVASHGHTIFHQPQNGFTLQIGDGQTFVSYLPCPLVNDFRSKDIAWGGQGAPLVPAGEKALFPDCKQFLNLGGFANISLHSDKQVIAWDISACNLIFNWLRYSFDQKKYDISGALAESGTLQSELYAQIDQLAYFTKQAPKSLGREWLETELLPIFQNTNFTGADQARTFAEHLSDQITSAVQAFKPLLMTGGGTHNTFIHKKIEEKLKKKNVNLIKTHSSIIDFKEAVIFAWLGLMTYLREINVLHSVTGAKKSTISGAIHYPN